LISQLRNQHDKNNGCKDFAVSRLGQQHHMPPILAQIKSDAMK
jgi:hypothetical protein